MSHHDLPSLPGVDDWVRACDLSKRGSEWCGPCPLCGGKDRFHVRDADGRALVGCRGCIDGRLQEDRRRQYSKLLREVFGNAGDLVTANAFTSRRRSSETRSRTDAARADLALSVARRIWDAGIKADGTPAHRYLVGRMVWPPNGVGPGLPASVRWLARDAAPAAVPGAQWFGLPPACAGAILYAFAGADGRIRSVSLDALDAGGARMEKRWRRTFGCKAGALFAVPPIGESTGVFVLCEGEVSALAAAWLHPGARCIATGGTAGMANVCLSGREHQPARIEIESDGDRRGEDAARKARDRLEAAGFVVHVEWRPNGDVADDLNTQIGERTAILTFDGGLAEDALPSAWCDMLRELGADRRHAPGP